MHSCSRKQPNQENGRYREPLYSGAAIRLRWKARRERHSAAAFLAYRHLAGRLWCRLSRLTTIDRRVAVETLAKQLMTTFGAPTIDDALGAAEEEMAFAESLCTQPHDMLIAVHRAFEDGAVRESFRTLRPRNGPKPARAFSFLEVEGESEQSDDQLDLISIADRERK